MAKIDELVVEVKGDVSDILKKLDDVSEASGKTSSKTVSSFSKIGSGIAAASKGFAIFGLAVEGAKAALSPFLAVVEKLNDASGIKRTADRIGLGVEKFQEYAFAAKKAGINTETMGDAIKDLGVKITDASNGATGYEEALNLIGLRSKDLIGLPVDQQFEKFADAMAGASAEARRFVADEINDSMFQLNPILKEGSEGLRRWAKEARDLNAVISESDFQKIEDANKSVKELSAGFEGLMNEVIVALAPMMKQFLDATVSSLKEINEWLGNTLESKKDKLAAIQKQLNDLEGKTFGGSRGMSKERENRNAINRLLEEEIQLKREISRIETATDPIQGPNPEEPFNIKNDVMSTQKGFGEIIGEATGQGRTDAASNGDTGQDGGLMTGLPWIFTEEGATMIGAMREQEIEAQKKFNASLQALEKANQEYNAKLWESGWKGKSQIMSQTLGQMSTLMNSENRKMFEIGKAAAIAQVAIDTPKAAMSAYSAMAGIPYVGPFLGAAAAAAALANGAMQIQNIKSQSFGGGGGGSSGVISADSSAGAEGGNQAPARNVTEATINVTGDGFVSADQVRSLAASLREFQADGGELVIK